MAADPTPLGDVVLARKDIPASYHLAVTVDDAIQGVTLVTRGEDLSEATHIHRVLQALLDLPTPRYRHHALLTDAAGRRLAKRDHALSVREMRAAGTAPERVLALALMRNYGRNRSIASGHRLSSCRTLRQRRPRMLSTAGFAQIGALIGDPARAGILAALLDGRALTATELARVSGVAPQTASGHLARLVEGGLLAVETPGPAPLSPAGLAGGGADAGGCHELRRRCGGGRAAPR